MVKWIATLNDAFEQRIPAFLFPLMARLALAGVFWKSMMTKVVDGQLFNIQQFYFYQAREDFSAIPLIEPDTMAVLSVYLETVLPVLFVLGLATRLSALAILFMTLVIQIFVYPMAWDSHLLWALAALYLMKHGAGGLSLDHVLKAKFDR